MATMNTLDRIWSGMSTADRVSLLGHSRAELTPADKIRLAKIAAALRKRDRHTSTRRPRRTRKPVAAL